MKPEMNTKRTEIKTFYIEKLCNECDGGRMIYHCGKYFFLNILGPYNHKCDKCGIEEEYSVIYPHEEKLFV